MNRSRLAALSAGAMFLVASVFVPATASADTGNTNTIKVLGTPAPINPPATGASFTVTVAANGSEDISGAGAGLTFDNTKLQLTAIAKGAAVTAAGASFAGFPNAAGTAAFISTANASGQIPNISYFYSDGVSFDTANTDVAVYTATFTITGTGNTTITPSSAPTILSGAVANYGNSLAVTVVNGTIQNSFQPIWTLNAPATASVLTGATTDVTVSTAVTQGAPGAIDLAASGLPAGVSASFAPASGTDAFSSTLTFTATAGAAIGTANVTVTATAGAVVKTQTISLSVVGNNDFTVSVSPNSLSVNGGATSSAANISTAILTGTPGTLALSATGLPTGVTANFASASVAAGTGTTVTFSADATAVNGVSTITINADSALYTKTATLSLNVIVISGVGATVNVDGTLDAGFLGLTCPTSLTIPLLRGNTNQLNVPCQVYTNTVWNLNVNDPKTTNRGHMTTADATPAVMPDSMRVLSRSFLSGGDVFYANNVDLADGSGTTCSVLQQPCAAANQGTLSGGTILAGTNSASAPLVLSQYVAPNTQPGSYGINLVFTAVSVF